MPAMFREPSFGLHYTQEPQFSGSGIRVWITRGANFAVIHCHGEPGGTLSGTAVDEQFVYALDGDVIVSGHGESALLGTEELAILPPGEWTMRFDRDGQAVMLITTEEPLARLAANTALYAGGAPEVAPIHAWPEPVGGYRLRKYSTLEAFARGGMVHAFRTRKLMMVPYARFLEPRDETQLTPHAHADFEQGSVALEGEWLHHLRVPWTANRRHWRADQHLQMGSPSTLIIPAGVIHTSQGIAGDGMRLIDVFAPPRLDFSEKGWVDNAADYPMPVQQAAANA